MVERSFISVARSGFTQTSAVLTCRAAGRRTPAGEGEEVAEPAGATSAGFGSRPLADDPGIRRSAAFPGSAARRLAPAGRAPPTDRSRRHTRPVRRTLLRLGRSRRSSRLSIFGPGAAKTSSAACRRACARSRHRIRGGDRAIALQNVSRWTSPIRRQSDPAGQTGLVEFRADVVVVEGVAHAERTQRQGDEEDQVGRVAAEQGRCPAHAGPATRAGARARGGPYSRDSRALHRPSPGSGSR